MKTIFKILGFLAVVVLGLFVARNLIIKEAITARIKAVTGLRLSIGDLDLGLLDSYAHITNLKVYNPQEYEDNIMLDVPELYIEYNLPAILKRDTHLPQVRIHLQEFFVVRQSARQLNLDSLKALRTTRQNAQETPQVARRTLRIDHLNLKIGTVIYKDYSKGAQPYVKTFPININQNYRNISNMGSIFKLIVVKALAKTTVASLADLDLSGVKATLEGTIISAPKEVVKTATKTIKATTNTTKAVADKATSVLKDLSESVKFPIKN